MDNTTEIAGLNTQSSMFSNVCLYTPRFADTKQVKTAENSRILSHKAVLTPNPLNAGFNNYGKTNFKPNQLDKPLRIKMLQSAIKKQKTLLFPLTTVSLRTFNYKVGRRDP